MMIRKIVLMFLIQSPAHDELIFVFSYFANLVKGHAFLSLLLNSEGPDGVPLDLHPLGGVLAAQRVHCISIGLAV